MKKSLLALTAVFLLTIGSAFAQCLAGYTWTQSQPNIITFTNTSIPPNPNTASYMWDFGDSQYSWVQNPAHTYSAPGNYVVCLTLMDSINMVQCTFCDTISVTGTVLCNTYAVANPVTPATCQSCNDGSATVNMYNGTAPYTYSWSNGGTTQTINALLPGLYTVCVTDVNGCTGCDSVTVGVANPSSCGITFVSSVNSQWVFFQSTVVGSSNAYTVTWNFGDASTGAGYYTWHQYVSNGTYTVCATMYDSLTSCTSTWCDTITINFTPMSCSANFYVQLDSVNTNLAWIYNLSTGGPSMTYQWFWGDNTPVDTGAYPSHTYQSTGSYNVCLVVVDQFAGCTDTMCQLLWVPRLTQQASLAPFYVNVVPPVITGITEPATTSEWSLYPNPANSELHIGGDNIGNDNYIVTDLAGRVVQSGTINNNTIDVSTLSNGVYFFTLVKENGETASKRFIRN